MKIKSGFALAMISALCLENAQCGVLKNSFFSEDKTKTNEDKTEANKDGGHIIPAASNSTETQSSGSAVGGNQATSGPAASEIAPGVSKTSEKPQPESRKQIVGDPVVLKIGHRSFKRSEILADLKLIPPQILRSVPSDKIFGMLIDQKMSTYLMVEQAKKAGMDRSPEFLARREHMENELLARMYLLRELKPKTENEVELKRAYQRYVSEYKSGKEVHLYQIVCDNENDAKNVIAELQKGKDFAVLAKEKSLAPSKENGGDESYIPLDLLPPEMKNALVALQKGEFTKTPIKLGKTFHVFKVGDTRDSKPLSFEECKPMLKQVVAQKSVMDMIARFEKQYNVVKFNEDGTPLGTKASPEVVNIPSKVESPNDKQPSPIIAPVPVSETSAPAA